LLVRPERIQKRVGGVGHDGRWFGALIGAGQEDGADANGGSAKPSRLHAGNFTPGMVAKGHPIPERTFLHGKAGLTDGAGLEHSSNQEGAAGANVYEGCLSPGANRRSQNPPVGVYPGIQSAEYLGGYRAGWRDFCAWCATRALPTAVRA